MVKLKGPLLSLEARGSLGNRLTYSQRHRKSLGRYQKRQADVITTGRTTQRNYFVEAYGKWNTLNDAQKTQWHDFVKS